MNEIEAAKEAVRLYFQGYSAKDAIEKVLKIKKDCRSSQNKLNSTITDIEKNYNIDNGQVYEEKSGESVDTTAEDACKYIFKGWDYDKEI